MIRLATIEDFDRLADMMFNFATETVYGQYGIDEETIHNLIHTFLDYSRNVIILYCADDAPQGMLIGVTTSLITNQHIKVASEMAWWMEPGYRNGKGSLQLQSAFEYWAKKMGATLTHMSTQNDAKVNRFMTRKGYTLNECTFVKET